MKSVDHLLSHILFGGDLKEEDCKTLDGVQNGKDVLEDKGGVVHHRYANQPCDSQQDS